VKHTVKVAPAAVPPAVQVASLEQLLEAIRAASQAVQSLKATADLEPIAGSIYSGVIRQYHDVRSFILAERPARIRMVGQAPVVRTDIFDMASDGHEFQVYIPSKQKFIVGKTEVAKPAAQALENLRPQHILEALLMPGADAASERFSLQEAEEAGRRYYVVEVFDKNGGDELKLKRRIWFDRSNLEIVRVQFYGPGGKYLEGVDYANYRDFGGIRYPTRIRLTRPVEDYALQINVRKASFNQPIESSQFELKQPAQAQRVDLSEAGSGRQGVASGQ
jgi:outer membrane lipoprotein-sorting protein